MIVTKVIIALKRLKLRYSAFFKKWLSDTRRKRLRCASETLILVTSPPPLFGGLAQFRHCF